MMLVEFCSLTPHSIYGYSFLFVVPICGTLLIFIFASAIMFPNGEP